MLKRPAEGSATICFAASDWDSFLLHPQMTSCVATRRSAAPAPDVAFRGDGTRLLKGGVVSFLVRFDGVPLEAQLSQLQGEHAKIWFFKREGIPAEIRLGDGEGAAHADVTEEHIERWGTPLAYYDLRPSAW